MLCVVGAVVPAWDAQGLQVKTRGQHHGFLLWGAWEILGSLCGADTQSQDKGWGQAAPPDIGSSAHSVPPVRRPSSCPRVAHREDSLKHLLVQAPRASPFCLCPRTSFHLNAHSPICPGALIPESKSWQDPGSLVQPFQSTDGETATQRGAGFVPDHRAGSCRALISIPGLGALLRRHLSPFLLPGNTLATLGSSWGTTSSQSPGHSDWSKLRPGAPLCTS